MIVEIRSAEGGNDSKILIGYQLEIYKKIATNYCL
jgi:protein subunit release factor A